MQHVSGLYLALGTVSLKVFPPCVGLGRGKARPSRDEYNPVVDSESNTSEFEKGHLHCLVGTPAGQLCA